MRQFILENQKIKNGLIVIDGKDFRYLRQVLRVKTGDMLNVRTKDGELKNTTVARIDDKGKNITLQICASVAGAGIDALSADKIRTGEGAIAGNSITRGVQATELNSLSDTEYWLFQFIPKPQKFEQIVRQATECGVSKIIPVIGEYTEKSSVLALEGGKKERIERIIREARQQSGSPVDTKVMPPMSLDEALDLWEKGDNYVGFVLSERDDSRGNLRQIIDEKKEKNIKIKRIGIGVGSEGGLSPQEVETLQSKGLFYSIHFAVNILRCETAAVYGIAAIQSAVN